MANRLTAALETDPAALAETSFEYLENAITGWAAAPGNLDTLIVEAISEEAALATDVASDATDAVFRAFGPLAGVPSLEAVAATATATFTFTGTAGYTIPANTTFGLRDPDYELRGFSVPNDVVVAPGASTVNVLCYALEEGSTSNGLAGAAEFITVPPYVSTISVGAPSAGAADAEEDETYLSRLAETLTLSTPRPILPNDFAVLARTVPGVFRATAIDGLKPSSTSGAIPTPTGAESTGNARTIAVAVTGVDGLSVGSGVLAAVQALLASERELNFLVYVSDPLYRAIAVTATVKAWPGFDFATVAADTQAAIRAFLNPATWAGGPDNDPREWLNESAVRLGMLYEALGEVAGVRYVQSLSFGPSGGSMGTADVDLGNGSARPALPTTAAGTTAGTGISVTVV